MTNKEDVMSTSEIGQKLGVHVNSDFIASVVKPTFRTEMGIYWHKEKLPLIAIGIGTKFVAMGMAMLDEQNDS
jgi:hypothetical protein